MQLFRRPFALLLLVGFSFACQQKKQTDTRAADESAIRAAVGAWSQAAAAKDLEKSLSFYADDASVLPFNAPIATGRAQVRQFWSQLMSNPAYGLHFGSTKVEAARSGDLAYEVGTFDLTLGDPKGKTTTNHGKYVVVWKKQESGEWKATADIFNTDQ